ncbi:MAG: hypothetical protein HC912_00905 [Saprospiraceae bacterium]|nr:hypothetical protein [Saprospiraceae bacterium]
MDVIRIDGNPLTSEIDPIINRSSFIELDAANGASDGGNINGPALIAVPSWIPDTQKAHPSAKYYLYFAHHGGQFIRMAWAANIEGPWMMFNYGINSGKAWGESGEHTGLETPGRGVLDLGVEKMLMAIQLTAYKRAMTFMHLVILRRLMFR